MKIHINYTEKGQNHSDFEAVKIVKNVIDRLKGTTQEMEINTTNQCVVNAARVELKKGAITKDEIAFYYERKLLTHDVNGNFKHYPKGFLENNLDLLIQLV